MIKSIVNWFALAALVSMLGGGAYAFFELKALKLERDLLTCQASGMKTAIDAQNITRAAEARASDQALKESEERNEFITQNALIIQQEKIQGNASLSLVLRNALERVRERYDSRYPS